MSKVMLINVTHAEESRVGIVENGQLESFEIESFSREHLKGNIYKGTVRRIHPAIEAAFVDIGAERDAFLPLDEICFRNLPSGRNGASAEKGRRRIKEVLKSGDEVLVQIIKEQFTNKPPTLSTFYSLPGRYLVLLPGSEDAGISRKIEGEERARVREMIERLQPPAGCGIIVRTAAGFDEESGELERDLHYLQRLWENIRKHAETKRAPALIYREHDLVLRNIRDYFTPDISEIFIDNEEVYERAKDFLLNVMPGKERLLHLYQGDQPIFSRFGLEAQIESIYKRRVQLRSGGSIVIDGTEALTAIDVNSGGSMRGGNQEDTAHKTNLEAAAEIGRQLRLRDLGGIVVIDFIDMRQQSHINDVERALREAMKPDKARHDIGRISRLGLLEVSRQRLRPAATASSYTACPMCEGHGAIRTPESAALVALRKIHNRIAEGDVAQMRVSLPREVAIYLLNQKREDLALLERRYAATITIVLSDKLMSHQSEIETRTRDASERPTPVVRPGEVAASEEGLPANGTSRSAAGAARSAAMRAAAAAPVAEAPSRRSPSTRAAGEERAEGERGRRRRRRGGRGRRAGEEQAVQEQSAAADMMAEGGPPVDVTDELGRPDRLSEPVAEPPEAAHEIATEAPSPWQPAAAAVVDDDPWSAALPAPVPRAETAVVSPGNGVPYEDEAGHAETLEAESQEEDSEGTPAESPLGEAAVPARRRRRRGGKRGGRGRRGGRRAEAAAGDNGHATGEAGPPGADYGRSETRLDAAEAPAGSEHSSEAPSGAPVDPPTDR
ncbi:MAG TPA: Rne/Rng family ribonuclease [Candidatus Binatia bacterium]|jgi:ribonuclease E